MQYIVLDTSPLIHLSMLHRLDLLEAWGKTVIPDMVVIEAMRGPDSAELSDWLASAVAQGKIQVPETDIGCMYRLAIQTDPNYRAKNAGEYAILDWIIDYLEHTHDKVVLLYENGKIPRLIGEWSSDMNIDIMTTRYFLHACEEKRLIASAEALWLQLIEQKLTVNPRMEFTQIRRSGP